MSGKRDDETRVESKGSKRKFLDADTHLKTAIYEDPDDSDADETVATSAISKNAAAAEPVPEAVSRVFAKAEELLADLSAKNRGSRRKGSDDDGDDPTQPLDDDDDNDDNDGESDDVTRLGRPPRKSESPRSADEETSIAVRRAPLADGSADMLSPDSVDTPVRVPPAKASTIGSSIDIGLDEAEDSTVLERRNPLVRAETTQVEAVPGELDGAPEQPTMPGTGAPLSDEPIAPGPMAAPTMPGAPRHANPAPVVDAPSATGDGLNTLSTESAPQGMPVPSHIQPRPMMGPPPRRSALGSFVDSVKRMFGWRPPPPPPPQAPPDDENFSGYGAGTYTVANRHVANRRRRDGEES